MIKLASVLLVSLLSAPTISFQTNPSWLSCHPKTDPTLKQYIIGYGSLISSKSKKESDPNAGRSIPVVISGFQRGWFFSDRQPGFGTTYLGARIKPKASFNAVLFSVPSSKSFTAYDEREVGYCRVIVPSKNIRTLAAQPLPKGEYWLYTTTPQENNLPSQKYPIVQSYVDIFLSGCFEIEERYHLNNFAKDCVKTTRNWSTHWVNDRLFPRRAFSENRDAQKIDDILASELPEYFEKITIE